MKLTEFYILNEYGRKSFGGFGRQFFSQQHYVYVASRLSEIDDEVVRLDLAEWISSAFARDNYRFKEDVFMSWVRERKSKSGTAKFEQRHFFYLSKLISDDNDPHRKEFLANWFSDMFQHLNHNFKEDVWKKACGDDSIVEHYGPAFGSRYFPGYGMKLFSGTLIKNIAAYVYDEVEDKVIRQHIMEWLADVFVKDNPNFSKQKFLEKEWDIRWGDRGNPRFQSRHFYYLAEVIKQESDVHTKVFICRLLSGLFEQKNDFFVPARWEDFCEIPYEDRKYKPEIRKRNINHQDRSQERED